MYFCEHGNAYNCEYCEIKFLKKVIEELLEENNQLKIKLWNTERRLFISKNIQ